MTALFVVVVQVFDLRDDILIVCIGPMDSVSIRRHGCYNPLYKYFLISAG